MYEGDTLVKECPYADTPAYIGRKVCGCVVAATVAEPNRVTEWSKDIREFVRDGLTVEPSTVGFVRHGGLRSCPHGKPRKARR